MVQETESTTIASKAKYHHGDLKEALIDAVQHLIIEKGVENFSLADACRLAGVSTAAPYRHFQDREEILCAVVCRAKDTLADLSFKAVENKGDGTLEAIIAIGQVYIDFAVERPEMFRIMFSSKNLMTPEQQLENGGIECFNLVIRQLEAYCEKNNIQEDYTQVAMRLWTFVHGAASLLVEGSYQKICDQVDRDYVHQMVADSAIRLLKS